MIYKEHLHKGNKSQDSISLLKGTTTWDIMDFRQCEAELKETDDDDENRIIGARTLFFIERTMKTTENMKNVQ